MKDVEGPTDKSTDLRSHSMKDVEGPTDSSTDPSLWELAGKGVLGVWEGPGLAEGGYN